MTNLPYYPSTPHLEDCNDLESVFSSDCHIEEKVDGANCGMLFDGEHFLARNRSNILKKGYAKKNTPAKLQFRPLWNWMYSQADKFRAVNAAFGEPMGIYGEWVLALHGILYDRLPDFFLAYDLWLPSAGRFVATSEAREVLSDSGFCVVPLLHRGPCDRELVESLTSLKSAYGPESVEGVVIKTPREKYKKLRAGYVQGGRWSEDKITKQNLRK